MDNTLDSHVHDHGFDPPAPWPNTWTEERIALLIELRNTNTKRGRIALEINSRTGSNFTRSAVCGKIDRIFPAAHPRLAEEGRAAHFRERQDRYNAKKREATKQRRIALDLDPDVRHSPPRKVQPLAVVVFRPEDFTDANVRGIPEFDSGRCRCPINGDMSEPIYCGLPQLEGRHYCAGHCSILYLPPTSRKEPGRFAG